MDDKETRPAGDEGVTSEPAGADETFQEPMEPAESRQGASARILLLTLLVVAAVAAGILFLLDSSQPAATTGAVERRPIVMPVPPRQEVESSAPTAPSEKPLTGQPVAMPVPPPPAAAVPAPVQAPAPVTEPPAAPATEFALDSGPFPQRRVAAMEKKITRLGYEPQRSAVTTQVPMTRLLVGVYPLSEMKARLSELAEDIPDAFPIRRGKQVAIYAGTYQDLDRARSFADQLYQKGIRVEEEPAQIAVTLYRVRFGRFSDREAANRAAEKSRSAGVEAAVVELP